MPMDTTPELDAEMLAGFSRGEMESVAEMFAKYGPYLRAIVRCQMSDKLRGKFDSVDVVQSVWVHVLRQVGREGWKFDDERQFRGLLATIARRRLISRVRNLNSGKRSADHHADYNLDDLPHSNQPRPSEIVQADDVWESLMEFAAPEHREILELKREGLNVPEIAAKTGLHEGSVRRILRQLASRMALHGEVSHEAETL
jgi:RNA polymerase sigma factor (sigma-70 family)